MGDQASLVSLAPYYLFTSKKFIVPIMSGFQHYGNGTGYSTIKGLRWLDSAKPFGILGMIN